MCCFYSKLMLCSSLSEMIDAAMNTLHQAEWCKLE